MWHRTASGEQGQSLIQFALMITTFLIFVSLAVDVGNLYAERRKMQNAADAGALAAARELCLGHNTTAATDSARDYLMRNGVRSDHIADQDISIQGNKVEVRARETVDTWFTGIMSSTFTTANVHASAKAACGAATSACGLWPIAFEVNKWKGTECGATLAVWNAENDNQEITCNEGDGNICNCYDCDIDDNGSNDFVVMTELARGWMDFPNSTDPVYTDPCGANGCGANELACRLQNGSGGRVTVGACIPGLRGVKAGVKDEVDSRSDSLVQIPLYDQTDCGGGSNCSGTEAESYRVAGFGCITVDGWVQNFVLEPKPGMPKEYTKITTKVILASKNCNNQCMSFCGSASDRPAEPWEVRAAGLTQ